MKRFKDKIALVTGGAEGIGQATVRRLAAEGAEVIIADYNTEAAAQLSSQLNAQGYNTRTIHYDAADMESGTEIVRKTVEWYGTIDVLVNNVGGSDLRRDKDIAGLDIDYFEDVFRLNLKSMLATIRAALPSMVKQKSGNIVNVSSMGGLMGDFRGSLYGMSKAGVINLTRYVASQYGKEGIRCNGVAPWLVLTPASQRTLPPELQQIYLKYNTVPYLGEAENIASTIAFLASDDARYISGQTLIVDGGMSCHNPTTEDINTLSI